uniref:Uncharacterized protein n=1 Tax=Anguilla anguilla TaxID=7936 RepID=A0A0E9P5D8_ANGAN
MYYVSVDSTFNIILCTAQLEIMSIAFWQQDFQFVKCY